MKEPLVGEWMRTDVVTINPELRVERVWETMWRKQVRHLPVIKQDILVGIITDRDLKRVLFPSYRRLTCGRRANLSLPAHLEICQPRQL